MGTGYFSGVYEGISTSLVLFVFWSERGSSVVGKWTLGCATERLARLQSNSRSRLKRNYLHDHMMLPMITVMGEREIVKAKLLGCLD